MDNHSIEGAFPKEQKFINKVSYNLMSKDATGELSQRKLRKFHNPLDPRYIHHTDTGRPHVIGPIDKNKPKQWVQPQPKQDTHRYMYDRDIDGGHPKKVGAAPPFPKNQHEPDPNEVKVSHPTQKEIIKNLKKASLADELFKEEN